MVSTNFDIQLQKMAQMTPKVLAVIPARGGSKGFKKKNIALLGDKPLLAWSIEASLASKYITKTFVSSDDDTILSIAKEYGANTIKRPSEFATDEASSQSVVLHLLQEIHEEFEYVVLLQPTSPLRDTQEIDTAFEKLFTCDASALISVVEYDNKILKAFVQKDGFLQGIANNKYPFMRRQDLPPTYMSNGAIYIIKVEEFLQHESFFTQKSIPHIMDEIKSIDIDTPQDLERVQYYI